MQLDMDISFFRLAKDQVFIVNARSSLKILTMADMYVMS